MPRPGPRPYECVRRAWHSDRHQPMRGSLIQEIFRVANEVHSPATRKNKEWQEKLPVVVLKAEEIMYSKANSEAEYMDLKTLWDRANEAIDTIIRRDDTPESGDLLQPCIEAALNLGCIPRRASRSQRHSNPGFYLSSSSMKEAAAASPKITDNGKAHLVSSTHLLPSPQPQPSNLSSPSSQSASWYSASATPTAINSGCPLKVATVANTSHEQKDSFPFLSKDTILSCQDGGLTIPMGTCTWPNLGRVYPLYYSDNQPNMTFQPTLQSPQDPSNTASPTMPCVPSIDEVPTGFLQNFFDNITTKDASKRSLNFEEASEIPSSTGCDLSLCLGLPSLGVESAWAHEVEDLGSSSSCDGRARAITFESSSSPPKYKGFNFFHFDTTGEPLESCSSKGSSEGEGVFFVEASDKKRKAPIAGSFEDGYMSWKQKITRVP